MTTENSSCQATGAVADTAAAQWAVADATAEHLDQRLCLIRQRNLSARLELGIGAKASHPQTATASNSPNILGLAARTSRTGYSYSLVYAA